MQRRHTYAKDACRLYRLVISYLIVEAGILSFMRMGRPFIMSVVGNGMVHFAGSRGRVNMNGGIGEVPQLMQEIVAHLLGNVMALLHRETGQYRNIDLCMEPMAQPSDPDFTDVTDPLGVMDRMSNLIKYLGIDPVQQPREDSLAGLPDDAKDDRCDDKAHNRIRQRISQPDPYRTD